METVPFASFFESLRKKGFSVTPAQVIHAHKTIRQYADKVRSHKDLCIYLAPVFAGTEEQQRLFTEIFHAEFKIDWSSSSKRNFQQIIEDSVRKNQLRLLIGYSILAAAIIAMIVFSFKKDKVLLLKPAEVSIHTKANPQEKLTDGGAIQLNINEKLELETYFESPTQEEKNLIS